MKVVLLRNVENVGKEGEIKNVSDGFARNFLIPQQLAEVATDDSVKRAEKNQLDKQDRLKKELKETQNTAQMLDGKEIVIKSKAQAGGKLFGSITPAAISQRLKEEKIQVKESSVILPKPIKELGEHIVKVKFNHGIEAELKVIIEAI